MFFHLLSLEVQILPPETRGDVAQNGGRGEWIRCKWTFPEQIWI